MDFVDYDWDDISGTFVKEGLLGTDFTFTTKSDLTHTVEYLPKNQARKLYTFSKEQLDLQKNSGTRAAILEEPKIENEPIIEEETLIEEVVAEEVTSLKEFMTTPIPVENLSEDLTSEPQNTEKNMATMSTEELMAKLQNYKKLLDNGLIMQGEYDRLKSEVLKYL